MKRFFPLSKISSYFTGVIWFIIFLALCILFIIKTFTISFWFTFLVVFFLICLTINYQILKRIFLMGISINNGYVTLQGGGQNETNKFHVNEIEKIELQDFKKQPVETQEVYNRVCICFILKSGRTKRLELLEIKNTKFEAINNYFIY